MRFNVCSDTIQKRRQLLIVFQPIFSFLTSSTMSTFQHCRPVNPVGLVKSKKYEMKGTDTVCINIKLIDLSTLSTVSIADLSNLSYKIHDTMALLEKP